MSGRCGCVWGEEWVHSKQDEGQEFWVEGRRAGRASHQRLKFWRRSRRWQCTTNARSLYSSWMEATTNPPMKSAAPRPPAPTASVYLR